MLILDEPTIGLDPQQIVEIRSLIKSLAGEHTVILSTHILPEVSMVCSGVVIINRGAIVAQGPIDRAGGAVLPDRARRGRDRWRRAGAWQTRSAASRACCAWRSERPRDGAARFVVESARGRDVRGEIVQLAAAQRWGLLELRQVGMTLEEVFMRIVAGEETRRSGAGDAGAGARRGGGGRVRIWPIFKKELRLYFTSPVAYVLLTIFLLIAGWFFYSIFAFFTRASMQTAMNPQMGRDLNVTDSVLRPLFPNMSVILLLLMPMLTMRLFAEERRAGTIELLLTYPVRDGEVLIGKYLAAPDALRRHAGRHAALSGDPRCTSPRSSGGRSPPATSGCC